MMNSLRITGRRTSLFPDLNSMPDRRAHRGPHPDDLRLFSADALLRLQVAERDLSLLLSRGYANPSALKLVGDRYSLEQRQRTAVSRCSCSREAWARRNSTRIEPTELRGRIIWIDGYNVLTSVEAALAGGVLLRARDASLRDMASMHGSWRKVEETITAIGLVGKLLAERGVSGSVWFLDRPVSNSGRLQALLRDEAAGHGWDWDVRLVPDPDPLLADADETIASADGEILNRCQSWISLASIVVERFVPSAWVVDLAEGDSPPQG